MVLTGFRLHPGALDQPELLQGQACVHPWRRPGFFAVFGAPLKTLPISVGIACGGTRCMGFCIYVIIILTACPRPDRVRPSLDLQRAKFPIYCISENSLWLRSHEYTLESKIQFLTLIPGICFLSPLFSSLLWFDSLLFHVSSLV